MVFRTYTDWSISVPQSQIVPFLVPFQVGNSLQAEKHPFPNRTPASSRVSSTRLYSRKASRLSSAGIRETAVNEFSVLLQPWEWLGRVLLLKWKNSEKWVVRACGKYYLGFLRKEWQRRRRWRVVFDADETNFLRVVYLLKLWVMRLI